MSYARLLATGSGKLGVRVSVEGLELEFVSETSMETTISGRQRVCCLAPMGAGIVFEEKANIPEATLDVSPNRFTLYETGNQDLSSLFMPMKSPTTETWLTATIDDNDTSIPVMSTTGFVASQVVHIGTEAIKLADPPSSGSNLLVTARAHWDTTAQYHYSADAAAGGQFAVLSSEPLRLRGRRVRVYLYGEGDDPLGSGTLRWIGKATSDPVLGSNGLEWSFSAEHIWCAVRTKIGTELAAPMTARGIYYSWASPLRIDVVEIGVAGQASATFVGFAENQADFLDALNAVLATDLTGPLASTYLAIEDPLDAGGWCLQVTVGTSITGVTVTIRSEQDGFMPSGLGDWYDREGNRATSTLTAGSTYFLAWNTPGDTDRGLRKVPRGYFGRSVRFERFWQAAQQTTFPDRRLYVSRPTSTDWTALLLAFGDLTVECGNLTVNTTSNHVTPGVSIPADAALYTSASAVEIRPGRTLATGDLASLRDGIVADAAQYANRGTSAWLTAGDLASWTSAVAEAARGRDFLSQRIFSTFGEIDLEEYLQHHFRLYNNLFPYLDSNAKVAVRQWSIPNATTANLTDLDDEILEGDWATIEADAHGSVNTVMLERGYDPIEDDFTALPITTINASSYASDHETRQLDVSPKSRASNGNDITPEEAGELFAPVLGYFGFPYLQIKIAVSWKLANLLLGSPVLVNSQHLPAFSGLRPMADVVGVVTGRRWALGEAYGILTVLVTAQNIAGYAPSARFIGTSATNVSGDTWDITIETGLYSPSGYTEDEFFLAGDEIWIYTYDSESPTLRTGNVVSVNTGTHVIRVTTDTAWTPGTGRWLLAFALHATVVAAQKVYAFVAADTGLLPDGSPARTFAP